MPDFLVTFQDSLLTSYSAMAGGMRTTMTHRGDVGLLVCLVNSLDLIAVHHSWICRKKAAEVRSDIKLALHLILGKKPPSPKCLIRY